MLTNQPARLLLPGFPFSGKINFVKKSWVELQAEVHPFLGEAVSNFLIEQGSPGVVQERVQRPSIRKRERIIAYFPNDRTWEGRRRKIRAYFLSLGKLHGSSLNFRSHIIQQKKWAEAWKSNFKLLHITPRLVIKPPWKKYPGGKGEVVIEIDPGMAFGTGTHPSTQMCLHALEKMITSFPRRPSVLDVGTGSGILAIAARILGAKRVLGIDTDSLAVASARKNSAKNKVAGGLDFRLGSLDGMRRVFDIVVANLLPQELLNLAPSLSRRISPKGVLILSGFLRGQKKEMASAFAEQGWEFLQSRESKGWVCFVLGRKDDCR